MSDERLTLSVEEAARLLGVGRGAAYEAARRGELPSVRLGRRILIPRHALGALLGETLPADAGESANDPALAGPSSTNDAASPRGRKDMNHVQSTPTPG